MYIVFDHGVGGIDLDILLLPFLVGTPKGSVAASVGVSRAMAGQLGWKYSWASHVCSFFAPKTAVFDSKPAFLSVFLPKRADLEISKNGHRHMGELFVRPWTKRGVRSILVVGKISHVIESTGFSSPTAPPRAPQTPRRPPRPPRRGLNKKLKFFKKKFGKQHLPETYSPPPGAASRPRLGARQRLIVY